MKKTYQPQVIELGDKMIKQLTEDNFFEESGITDIEPAKITLYDSLTEKFIQGKITDGSVEYEDEEFLELLNLMICACIITNLKKMGLVNSFDNENNEEMFFLTKKGKDVAEKLNKN